MSLNAISTTSSGRTYTAWASRPISSCEEPFGLPGQHLVGQPFECLPEHDEPAALGVARTEVEVAERAPAAAASPLDREHDEIERPGPFDLQPRLAAACRPRTGHPATLAMTPSWPAATAAGAERRGLFGRRRDEARHDATRGAISVQRVSARRDKRLVDQRIAVKIQAVEEKRRDGQRLAQAIDIQLAPEPPHRRLERVRRAVGLERDRLAVENRSRAPACARAASTTSGTAAVTSRSCASTPARRRRTLCTWIRAPSSLYSSDASPSSCRAVVDVGRRPGQHRLDRLKRPHDERVERGLALDERSARNWRESPGEHGRAPDTGRRDFRRPRHGLEQHPFERALTQLAEHQADEKILFVRGRARAADRAGFAAFAPADPGPRGGDAFEGRIDVAELERGSFGRRRGARLVDGGAANPDAALTRRSAQESNRDLDFGRRECSEECRETVDLLQAAARLGDGPGREHQLRKPHTRMLPKESANRRALKLCCGTGVSRSFQCSGSASSAHFRNIEPLRTGIAEGASPSTNSPAARFAETRGEAAFVRRRPARGDVGPEVVLAAHRRTRRGGGSIVDCPI